MRITFLSRKYFSLKFISYSRHGRHSRNSGTRWSEPESLLRRRRREPSEPITQLKENNFKPEFDNCSELSKKAKVPEGAEKGKQINYNYNE